LQRDARESLFNPHLGARHQYFPRPAAFCTESLFKSNRLDGRTIPAPGAPRRARRCAFQRGSLRFHPALNGNSRGLVSGSAAKGSSTGKGDFRYSKEVSIVPYTARPAAASLLMKDQGGFPRKESRWVCVFGPCNSFCTENGSSKRLPCIHPIIVNALLNRRVSIIHGMSMMPAAWDWSPAFLA